MAVFDWTGNVNPNIRWRPRGQTDRDHTWLAPPWQVQMMTRGAVGGGRAGHVEAHARLGGGDGAVRVEPELLVRAAVAVPQRDLVPGAVAAPTTSRHRVPS